MASESLHSVQIMFMTVTCTSKAQASDHITRYICNFHIENSTRTISTCGSVKSPCHAYTTSGTDQS
jgi:hypothetical protein